MVDEFETSNSKQNKAAKFHFLGTSRCSLIKMAQDCMGLI